VIRLCFRKELLYLFLFRISIDEPFQESSNSEILQRVSIIFDKLTIEECAAEEGDAWVEVLTKTT